MFRRRIMSLLLCVMLAVGIGGCAPQGITGDEWLLMQEDYLPDLEQFASNMDEVFSLYTTGSMSANDFVTEINILKNEYAIIEAVYKQDEANNPILPESYSYVAQRGIDSIETVRDDLKQILDDAVIDGTPMSADEVVYSYIIHRQKLTNDIAEYVSACQIIKSSKSTTASEADQKGDN